MYGASGSAASAYGWPYPASAGASSAIAAASMDLYYRQAAAAAALQKPLPYRLYPGHVSGGGSAPISTSSPLPTYSGLSPLLSASASAGLTSLASVYHPSAAAAAAAAAASANRTTESST